MATDKKSTKKAAANAQSVKTEGKQKTANQKNAKPANKQAEPIEILPTTNTGTNLEKTLANELGVKETAEVLATPKKGKGKKEAKPQKSNASTAAKNAKVKEKAAKEPNPEPAVEREKQIKSNLKKVDKGVKPEKTIAVQAPKKPINDSPQAKLTVAVVEKPSKGNGLAKKAAAVKKAVAVAQPIPAVVKVTETTVALVTLQLRYHTKYGQALFITGNHPLFGNNDIAQALPLKYLNHEFWAVTVHLDKATIPDGGIVYNYFIRYEDGSVSYDWGNDKVLLANAIKTPELFILDSWNYAGYFENAFYTEPFKHVLLTQNYTPVSIAKPANATHLLKVKAPLLLKGQTLAVAGSVIELGNWDEKSVVLLSKEEGGDFFSAELDLSKAAFPIMYKYLVYDVEKKQIVYLEHGNNRTLYNSSAPGRLVVINDGFAVLPNNSWKGAGVAVPVFSLRSADSGGVGEFADIKLLVDWAKKTGLRLVQLLPVNDTTATHSWTDSYPYAAISAFALHPMYLRLEDLTETANKHLIDSIQEEKKYLNGLATVDYEAVNKLKWKIIRLLYPLQKDALFATEGYGAFFKQNSHWLVPYAVFCYLRDKYNTADFNTWQTLSNYSAAGVEALLAGDSGVYNEIAIHFFIQYHLHVQLKNATQYAHENGVIVKGDIPIGVYRFGADAWQNPGLYHMGMQAGAPPDDFAVTGQNWGFPTYNWEKMKTDGFAWWKQRLEQMSHYFDAFRIDHILGFFRIWAIPVEQVEGIMGHFEPSIPIHINEFNEKGIWFDHARYCRPYITDKVLNDNFGDQQNYVRQHFLLADGNGNYHFKEEYATQRQLENYFASKPKHTHNQWLKQTLFNLISNVILFEVEGANGQQFHFRFGVEGTSSFQNLYAGTQAQLRGLYVNYYFRRQDGFWMGKALETLPALKRVTNMLVCGEDLGLVPACVPEVMKQLGLLSLEIQRMPKDSTKEFFHPADAPYLSVVTPSTHDMSTIRGWWEEDRHKTQRFFNNVLGHWGAAPHFCDAEINKAVVVQHLQSPGMWAIFQLQDLLGCDKEIRRDNPHDERINVPAIPQYYWRYRMHLTLEQLLEAGSFNEELLKNVTASGR